MRTLTFTFHLYCLFQREIYGKVAEELAAKKRDPCWIYPMAKEEATTILRARVKVSVKCLTSNKGSTINHLGGAWCGFSRTEFFFFR